MKDSLPEKVYFTIASDPRPQTKSYYSKPSLNRLYTTKAGYSQLKSTYPNIDFKLYRIKNIQWELVDE